MEMYFLKSAACLSILLLFYKILLEKETMHVFKRFYLLAAPVISFGIPAVSFPEYVVPPSEGFSSFAETDVISEAAVFPLFEVIAGSIYALGVLFFGSRFVLNIKFLLHRANSNPTVKTKGAVQVLVKNNIDPHTFWTYIFVNREKFERKQIPQEVLDHELAHVKQRHSADLIFIEILQVFLWFIPLIYFLKKAVKLNHEFLADRSVLRNNNNSRAYQHILLSFSSGEYNSLVNSINYSSIKKRFTVMKKQPSQKAILLRSLLFLPLLAGLLYSFSSRETIVSIEKDEQDVQILSGEDFRKEDKASSEHEKALKDLENAGQEKATPQMIAEYNKWAKHYKENEDDLVEKKVWERMKYIYSIMTPAQKKDAEQFPSLNPNQIITIVEERQEERAAMKREREVVKEERKAVRREREAARAEKQERQMEKRQVTRQVPPPPPPPPAPEKIDVPMPPPPPPSPVEAVQGWVEEGAQFYYNGKAVSGEEALKAVQKNNGKNLNVQVQENNSGKTVRISDNKR